MSYLLKSIPILMLASASAFAEDPKLSLSVNGLGISAGSAGSYTLSIPGLKLNANDYTGEKPVAELKDGKILAKYPSGAEVTMSLEDNKRAVKVAFSGVPSGALGLIFTTQIPIRYNAGGKFILGKQPAQAFPDQKEAQIVGQGWAEAVSFIDPSGAGFRYVLPGEYQQVQDNRVFNWPVFMHIYTYQFATRKGQSEFKIRVEDIPKQEASSTPAATASAQPGTFLIDRYGQSARKEFPEKVKKEEELKADWVREEAELAAFTPDPKLDKYGGLAGSGEKYHLKKTGFFHTATIGDRHVLVTPDGNAFFQLAVCGITNTDDYTIVKGREKVFEWIPPQAGEFQSVWRPNTPGAASFYIANVIRKSGKPYDKEEWSARAVKRLRSWGFNSSGAFSGDPKAFREADFANVAFLPLGEGGGIKVLPSKIGAQAILDPFVPGSEEALDKRFEKLAQRASDSLLIGYYLGNEQHFELLPKIIPSFKASQVAAKGRLVEMLRDKYKDIASFNAAWNPAKPFGDFEALKEEPLFVRSDAAAADMKEFYALYLETYFSLVNRVFRKHDPNHLLIGSRLTPGTANNEIAGRASSKYMDVNSINYYSYATEKPFLERFYAWSGKKPIIFSEWYFSATDHGLNGGKEVKNQTERANGYRNYVEQAAALPFVVGSQWFIFMDQAITGRFFEGFNGEGANTGIVSVTDRPYKDLVEAAKLTHGRVYDIVLGKEKPYAFDDPRFNGKAGGGDRVVVVPKSLPGFKMDGTTTNWPGRPAEPIEASRLVLGSDNPNLRGDFRLCWDEQELHFLIQVKDPTPLKNNKKGDRLWSADGVELFIGGKNLTEPGNMIFSDRQILIGAKEEAEVYVAGYPEEGKKCRALVVKDVSGDGYVLQVSIPWSVLDLKPSNGLELLFDVAIDNSDDGDYRKQQLVWNGTSKNSDDRAAWGRARIVDN